MDEVEKAAAAAVAREDFEAAMAAMAKLRAPVDAFFDYVTVNADGAGLAREPLAPVEPHPRHDPDRRRLLQDRRLTLTAQDSRISMMPSVATFETSERTRKMPEA